MTLRARLFILIFFTDFEHPWYLVSKRVVGYQGLWKVRTLLSVAIALFKVCRRPWCLWYTVIFYKLLAAIWSVKFPGGFSFIDRCWPCVWTGCQILQVMRWWVCFASCFNTTDMMLPLVIGASQNCSLDFSPAWWPMPPAMSGSNVCMCAKFYFVFKFFSLFWRCWVGNWKHMRPVKLAPFPQKFSVGNLT